MDVVPTIIAVSLVILTIVLSVVGVQLVLVLIELKKVIHRVNEAIDTADNKIAAMMEPLQKISTAVAGLGTGMKVFEAFVGWLQRDKKEHDKK